MLFRINTNAKLLKTDWSDKKHALFILEWDAFIKKTAKQMLRNTTK